MRINNLIFIMLVGLLPPAHASLPVEECPTFLEETLTLLCFQQSIVDELKHQHYRLPIGTIHLNLAPNGSLNHVLIDRSMLPVPGLTPAYALSGHFPVIEEILKNVTLSPDNPSYNYFEMELTIIPGGDVQVTKPLIKRSFRSI